MLCSHTYIAYMDRCCCKAPILLQWTSLLFLYPLHLSWMIDQTPVYRYGLAGVIAVSWVYHGTYDPAIRVLDLWVVNSMVSYHMLWGMLWCEKITWNVVAMLATVLYSCVIHHTFRLNETHGRAGELWHASIHVAMAVGSAAIIGDAHCSAIHS
jgi:hypothetical protein